MSRDAVPINEAARILKKSPSALRRWVQKGCPCVRPGETGRGKGAILNLSDVLAWRGGGIAPANEDDRLQFITNVLVDVFKRDQVNRVDITVSQGDLAGILALVYERYYKNLIREPLEADKLPPEIKQLVAIYVHSKS